MKILQKTIAPGDEIWVQIAPFGTFEKDGIAQRCDREAFEQLIAAFEARPEGQREVLVDYDHEAETGGSTEAAAWISALKLDPEKGLLALFTFTDKGAQAVMQRRLRYVSACWNVAAEDARPFELLSVGLTNKPNLPVAAVLNRADTTLPPTVEPERAAGEPAPPPEMENPMEEIIAKLGLAPEATAEEVLAEIDRLQSALAQAQERQLEGEAEEALAESEVQVENRAAWIAAYKANPAQTRVLLNSLRAPKRSARAPRPSPAQVFGGEKLCNSADASAPKLTTLLNARSCDARLAALRTQFAR